jgi:AraC-like DNA-binding protein/ligand-binding sensor protein
MPETAISGTFVAMISAAQIDRSPAFRRWCDAFRRVARIDVHLLDPGHIETDLRKLASSLELCRLFCLRCERCGIDRRRFAARLLTADGHHAGPFAMRCGAGLTVTALPVRLANGTTVFLSTGPMLVSPQEAVAARRRVAEHVEKLVGLHRKTDLLRLVSAVPTRDPQEFKAAITMLRLLAEHLSHMSLQMLAVTENAWVNCAPLRRACELVEEQFTEDLHLDEIAHRVGASRSYLSHEFRRRLGLTFTEFLAERRVIEMKHLLRDPAVRVSEAMLASGFQSVSQGNRIFRATTGMSPSDYRATVER